MEKYSEICVDNQENLNSTQQKLIGCKKTRKNGKYIETLDALPTCKHLKVSRGSDIPNVTVSTNGDSLFSLEGENTSVSFSRHGNENVPITTERNIEDDSATQTEKSNADNSALVSQAQTLIDLFHEMFRTSSSPLQIVLEPHKSGDVLYLEQKLGDFGGNLTMKEAEECKEVKDHRNLSVKNYEERANVSKLEHGYYQENHKELSILQLIHRCHYCSFGSEAVSLVVEHIKNYHPNKQLRTKTISGRNCPYCGLRLEQSAFFQHMRQYHGDAHPFRCGYCSFMGRDLNQVKHHCSKKHPDKLFKCFRRSNSLPSHSQLTQDEDFALHSKESVEEKDDGKEKDCISEELEEIGETMEEVETLEGHDCPVCKKTFKTLKYLKVHMRVHSRVRFKCGYCSYLSVYFLQVLQHCKKRHKMLQPRVKQHDLDPSQNKNIVKNIDSFMEEILKKASRQPADPDTRKWARRYCCPHCEYTCSYGASYRRHLTLHSSKGLPFRCKYCPYEGREKYYVRRHIQRVHRGCPLVVVENEPRELITSREVKFSNCLQGRKSKLPKRVKSVKKSNSENQALPQCTVVSSFSKENNFSEREVRLDLGKLVEELHGSSEEFDCEGTEGLKMSGKGIETSDDGHSKTLAVEKVVATAKKISEDNTLIEGSADLVITPNQEEVVHILSWNEDNNVENIQLNKPRRTCSRRHALKKRPVMKNGIESKTPILLPKISTPTSDEVNEKSVNNASSDDNLEKVLLMNDSCTEMESIKMNAEKSLDANVTGHNKESSLTTEWRDIGLEGSIPSHFPENSMKMDGEDILICKKKKNKEKSTHKVKKFLARKEGKHSYCICGARTVNKAFYKHIRKHLDFKPYGCGYCYYRSIERAKVRVHHAFVHPGVPLIVKEYWDDKKEDVEERNGDKLCQEIGSSSKMNIVSNISSQIDAEKGSASRSRATVDFHCPICGKKISFHSYTIRRHIFAHYDYRPYQCGKCDFKGCSPGDVKQHSVYHGADCCPVVIPSGQQPPDGLEQLVDDCFKTMRTKVLGHSAKRKPASGYKLVTKEAISWQETLTQGRCPWCKVYTSSPDGKALKSFSKRDINCHFKLHFYKPMENSSDTTGLEEIAIPTNPPSSLEEKDAIIMNGLMNYLINHPIVDNLEMECPKDMDSGERGIINSPDGMPEGTIQIADSFLADLRHLLWGQEIKISSRKSRKPPQKRSLNSSSTEAVELKSEEYQGTLDHHQLQTVGDSRNKQYPLWGIVETNGNPQAQDGEVGVLLLGDDIEMTTAVVVVNPEMKDSADVEVEVSI